VSKLLYDSLIILREDVCRVRLYDITPPDLYGRKVRVEVSDPKQGVVELESKDIEMSQQWIDTQPHSELDLLMLLIQFRHQVPRSIYTSTESFF